MILDVPGIGKVFVENWSSFENKLLSAIGFQVVDEIRGEIERMKLLDTGELWRSYSSKASPGKVNIVSVAPHAPFIEYGTLEHFDRHGLGSFPSGTPLKKKDLSVKDREGLPKGGGVFAPMRRVLWNKARMGRIINRAVKLAGK